MRIAMLIAGVVFCAGAVAAPNLEAAIGSCAAQPDAKARLACYDAVAAQLKTTPTAAPAAQVSAAASAPAANPPTAASAPAAQVSAADSAPAAKPPAATSTPAEFGAENLSQPAREAAGQPEPLDEIKSGVTEVYFSPFGRFIVTLANGQIWRQLDSDTGRARFNKNGGDTVTISRGFIGSYNLVVDGHNGLFKVARIK